MTNLNYNRFKDELPANTVHKIRNILHGLGLATIDAWVDSGIKGCYSTRVSIVGTTMGANGKGTDPVYALASAYAELMERLQNKILYLGRLRDEDISQAGFIVAPDEKYQTIEELAAVDNALISQVMLKTTGYVAPAGSAARRQSIQPWAAFHPPGRPSQLVTIPFYNVNKGESQYLLFDMYTVIYGSNGMCAGNTPEEALVQGLAEIMERHVNNKLITDQITPPTIPDSYLSNYPGLYAIIQAISRGGRYRVLVKDCSLGQKYPVVGIIIIDSQKGTFGMKLGTHPYFNIALERTITEAFQGCNLDLFTGICRVNFTGDYAAPLDNATNIAKIGAGEYPAALLGDNFSYPFTPFMDDQAGDNKKMLRDMVKIVTDQGYEILVRDVSFLGFPSYHIIVPGFSEIYPIDLILARELKTYMAATNTTGRLGQASKEELERIVRYILFKRNSLIENQMFMIMGRPLTQELPGGRDQVNYLMGLCLYKLGQFKKAYQAFKSVAAHYKGHDQYSYYDCVASFALAKSSDFSDRQISAVLQKLYTPQLVQKVIQQFSDPNLVFERAYLQFNCWDCDYCPATAYCCYRETVQVLNVVKERYAAHPIKQNQLAHIFAPGGAR